jgi:amino acid transporter
MFPNEGSLYNWTHKALGGYWSFFVAFCAWFPGVLVMITAGDVIVAYIQGLNANWLTVPWQQGLVIISVIAIAGVIAVQRFRMVQNTINMVVILTFVGVFLIGLAGLVWLAKGHPSATSFRHFSDWSINWTGNLTNISLFGLITLAYLEGRN